MHFRNSGKHFPKASVSPSPAPTLVLCHPASLPTQHEVSFIPWSPKLPMLGLSFFSLLLPLVMLLPEPASPWPVSMHFTTPPPQVPFLPHSTSPILADAPHTSSSPQLLPTSRLLRGDRNLTRQAPPFARDAAHAGIPILLAPGLNLSESGRGRVEVELHVGSTQPGQ